MTATILCAFCLVYDNNHERKLFTCYTKHIEHRINETKNDAAHRTDGEEEKLGRRRKWKFQHFFECLALLKSHILFVCLAIDSFSEI